MDRKSGRNSDGTFRVGNPGKPKGTRHKATRAALAILEGEAEALTRRAVELALDGDRTALRLVLERVLPPRRDAPVVVHLPIMKSAADASLTSAAVLEAAAAGELTLAEATAFMALVEAARRAFEASETSARRAALEDVLGVGGGAM